MNDFEKPLYSIYPTIYCSGSVYVNDVPVVDWYGEKTKGEGGYAGDVIINQALLQSGKHKIVGKLLPRMGQESLTERDVMMIDFYCAEADRDKWKESRIKFHPKIESPWDGLTENIKHPYFEIETEIEVELPFVLDGWQNSVNLTDFDEVELFQEVLSYYRQIQGILQIHDAPRFLELSREKMKLQEQAFYFSEERKESFKQSAAKLFNQNLEVEPLNEDELEMQIMGNGKLVRLMKRNGGQPLQFKSPDIKKQGNIELEVKLHMRSQGNGLSII
ncbi:hypothetical protein LS482_13945 [Sinomicrobium kalidii]|uniref:hypothetical protein n=1 Tax=Sinomicrobium kalidii TaxID=2900738 RepID=UPI001E34151F|nr:hypothetical protein [Sinomicrobium kalidii]UGU14794.1 hypothetical protein LS482_13945 [Sinomicrobium kalidii]